MSSIGAESAALLIREIGSFHIGGGMVRLAGLPPRARVSTRGGPVHPIDPNGEIMVGRRTIMSYLFDGAMRTGSEAMREP